jgi:hypothetical protein
MKSVSWIDDNSLQVKARPPKVQKGKPPQPPAHQRLGEREPRALRRSASAKTFGASMRPLKIRCFGLQSNFQTVHKGIPNAAPKNLHEE